MHVLDPASRPELPAQPERERVLAVPIEGRLQRVVKIDERLLTADRDRPAHAVPALQLRAEDVHLPGHRAPLGSRWGRRYAPRETEARGPQWRRAADSLLAAAS